MAKRILGAVLIALPIVAYLTVMVIAKGWLFGAVVVVLVALCVACVVGGMHLLSPKNKDR